ncbi:MAG TPA: Uma2 family endonuclease [Planctomycetaceae bacterium]|nr:Uma2 family endonuclease [Planctomycetaceae bacterium]
MTTQLELNSSLAPPLPLRRFSVVQYRQLGELGVLTPEDHVELLEGWIVEKMNQRPRRGYVVGLLSEWFQNRLPKGYIVRCQLPITTQRSEPEPDIAIVSGVPQNFRSRHPSGHDCRLIIEVSDSSLEKDRAKAAIYQSAGVVEYWIVNINSPSVEQYRFSDPSTELQPTILAADAQVAILFSEKEITLDLGLLLA